MGHCVSAKGIGPAPERIDLILRFRRTESGEASRDSFGCVMSERVPDLADKAAALGILLKEGSGFDWHEKHTSAFKELKGHRN